MEHSELYRKIGRNCLIFLIAMAILSVVVFFVASYAPGDPLQSFYGDVVERMSTAEQMAARHRLGLDGPVYERYGIWLDHAVHGDFGISLKYKEPASQVIADYIGNTLILG